MICGYCRTENKEDAVICIKCGKPLVPEYEDKKEKPKTKNQKTKNHKKTKNRTKTKNNEKTKIKKQVYDNREKGRMNFSQKSLMAFLTIMCIVMAIILGFIGYKIYKSQNIIMPNLVGMKYEDAVTRLNVDNLNYIIKEVETENESENNTVIKQSKKAGSKAKENAIILVTVGKYDEKVTIPNVTNLTVENALNILNKNKINYEIKYEESNNNGIVLSQSIKANKKVSKKETLIIKVSKQKETQTEDKTTENEDNQNNNQTVEE